MPLPVHVGGKLVHRCVVCPKTIPATTPKRLRDAGWVLTRQGYKCEICRYEHWKEALLRIFYPTDEEVKPSRDPSVPKISRAAVVRANFNKRLSAQSTDGPPSNEQTERKHGGTRS